MLAINISSSLNVGAPPPLYILAYFAFSVIMLFFVIINLAEYGFEYSLWISKLAHNSLAITSLTFTLWSPSI